MLHCITLNITYHNSVLQIYLWSTYIFVFKIQYLYLFPPGGDNKFKLINN